MVKVTIDTARDSPDEILKAVEFLKTFAETRPEEETPVPMGMFDAKNDKDKKPDDIKVLEY